MVQRVGLLPVCTSTGRLTLHVQDPRDDQLVPALVCHSPRLFESPAGRVSLAHSLESLAQSEEGDRAGRCVSGCHREGEALVEEFPRTGGISAGQRQLAQEAQAEGEEKVRPCFARESKRLLLLCQGARIVPQDGFELSQVDMADGCPQGVAELGRYFESVAEQCCGEGVVRPLKRHVAETEQGHAETLLVALAARDFQALLEGRLRRSEVALKDLREPEDAERLRK